MSIASECFRLLGLSGVATLMKSSLVTVKDIFASRWDHFRIFGKAKVTYRRQE